MTEERDKLLKELEELKAAMAELEGTLQQENEAMKKELEELRAAHANCDEHQESSSSEIT